MKSDFLIAMTQLAAEKKLPKEVVLEAVEAALASALKKDAQLASQNIAVKVLPATGEVKIYILKDVVEEVKDPQTEISLTEATKLKIGVSLGETLEVETTLHNAGRIAAHTAKQVVLQRLREAERDTVFEEFAAKEGEVVSGIVQRIEPKQIVVDLGKMEAILPSSEQVRSEHYRVGQRLKVYLMELHRTNRGPQVIVSRSHRNLLRRLFELEVPEIYNGVVELKSIAREPGYRSKVAVAARQEGVDPVGACVGLRGIRIQNIVTELNGEKIDVVPWDPDTAAYVAKALSPAQVQSVEIHEEEKTAYVVVPDRQLSLAIGKEGQNARLAAKLTGWRIDIRSASLAAAEKAEREALAPIAEEIQPPLPSGPAIVESLPPLAQAEEAPLAEIPSKGEYEPMEAGDLSKEREPVGAYNLVGEITGAEVSVGRSQIRFAEEIMPPKPIKPGAKAKKGKSRKEAPLEADLREGKDRVVTKSPKARRSRPPIVEEDEEEFLLEDLTDDS
ncbi:MAG: transcription termination/antitermination protein NusA [Chloroflexi bacterium]|nr:transcription termination/antitermination protein NusA [Chloroflexota bacterium]